MLFPRTKWYNNLDGANASNTIFRIKMRKGLPYPRAVWAQEYYESRLKRNPINLIRSLLSKSFKRKMEIMSHEIEVQQAVNDGADEKTYRLVEVINMHTGYDGLFSSMTRYEIEQAMIDELNEAFLFTALHEDKIKKYGTEPNV